VEQTTSLTEEDVFFFTIADMSEFKLNPYDLQHIWTYIDVMKAREYLMIKSVKEEAYRRDMQLEKGT
jgi:hypothetical protein